MKGMQLGRRRAGMLLTGAGVLMLLSGVAGLASTSDGDGDGSPEPVVDAQSPVEPTSPVSTAIPGTTATAGPAATTTKAPLATTEVSSATTAATTTTTGSQPPPTTTPVTTPATTTTMPPAERVAAFVEIFAAAIAAGDVDALMSTLHPAVIDAFGEDLCRSFTDREILALEDYALVGAVTGPVSKTLDGGGDPVLIAGIYEAGVQFTFQGQSFTTSSDFVVADTVSWLAICR